MFFTMILTLISKKKTAGSLKFGYEYICRTDINKIMKELI